MSGQKPRGIISAQRRNGLRPPPFLSVLAILALVLSACSSAAATASPVAPSPAASSPAASSPIASQAAPSAAATAPAASSVPAPALTDQQIAALGPVTLTIWDDEVTGTSGPVVQAAITGFQQKYPNVTINRTAMSFQDILAKVKLGLSGPNPPDVFESNMGNSLLGPLVKAGLVTDLTPFSQAYGWDTRFSAAYLQGNSFSPEGKWGTGDLYGLGLTVDFVGVYYNKAKLQKLGIPVPVTLSDFTAALDKAKQAGEVPLMIGALSRNPASHLSYIWWNALVPKSALLDWSYQANSPNICSDGWVQGAATVQKLAESGYFVPGWAGTNWGDTVQQFIKGQGVFYPTGTWFGGDIGKGLGANAGFFIPVGSEGAIATGFPSGPWSVSKGSKHPDLGAAFLNYMTDPSVAALLIQNGGVPAMNNDLTAPDPNSVMADELKVAKAVADNAGLIPYPDNATPTLINVMAAATIELYSGQKTPQQWCQAIQDEAAKFTP